MSETLEVAKREKTGKLNNRRLRRSGRLPAVLYGHGADPLNLSANSDAVAAVLRHGSQVVKLTGAASGQALLQDVQLDAFQRHVLHLDLLRVVKGERVQVEVSLQLRGEAPGEKEGGVVEQVLREVEIETSPANIPESLHVSINKLQLHSSATIADIEDLPDGAKVLHDADEVVVHCVEPTVAPEEEEALAGGVEPELISGRESEEEREGGGESQ